MIALITAAWDKISSVVGDETTITPDTYEYLGVKFTNGETKLLDIGDDFEKRHLESIFPIISEYGYSSLTAIGPNNGFYIIPKDSSYNLTIAWRYEGTTLGQIGSFNEQSEVIERKHPMFFADHICNSCLKPITICKCEQLSHPIDHFGGPGTAWGGPGPIEVMKG
jgi:hypothetical protein